MIRDNKKTQYQQLRHAQAQTAFPPCFFAAYINLSATEMASLSRKLSFVSMQQTPTLTVQFAFLKTAFATACCILVATSVAIVLETPSINIIGSRLASFFSFARRGKLQEPQNFPLYDKIYTRSPLNAIGTFHYSSR